MNAMFYYDSPIGPLTLIENGQALTGLFFGKRPGPEQAVLEETPLFKQACLQLSEYFEKKRTAFTLPLEPEGSAFEKAVWKALTTIPYGQTKSYGEIAAQIGRPKACRAVGLANSRNPISILIPCHRVIGANAALTGYAGGLENKRFLLELEGADFKTR